MSTSLLSILLATAGFVVYEYATFRQLLVNDLSTKAEIIGQNCAAAILFANAEDAQQTLEALRSQPHIESAAVYNKEGGLLATYARVQSGPPDPQKPEPDGYRFGQSRLRLFQPIITNKGRVGTLYVESNLDALNDRIVSYGSIALLVVVTCSVVAFLFASRLQKRISQPILALAETSRVVSERQDYSVRAQKISNDELGTLADAFNGMLSQIQQRQTDRRKAEEEIRKLNLELEERIQQRTAQLEATNMELEAFSYSVSHDLRSPLRSIDGFSQALLEDEADKVSAQGKDYLQRVRAAAQRMAELIDDLINLSRVTRAEMRLEKVNLTDIALSIARELKEIQPDRKVEFLIADGIGASGDARLLRVVLDNLLGNAWKYTGKHPKARIEFGITGANGGSAYYVRDDGAGFDMAYSDKLFGAFQRLHATSEYAGTGIGLATVQRIVRRHGGRIWAEGKVDEGATFYFTLS